jgi:hypothetical protein
MYARSQSVGASPDARISAAASDEPCRSTCSRLAIVASRSPGSSVGTGLSRHNADSIFRYGDVFSVAAS